MGKATPSLLDALFHRRVAARPSTGENAMAFGSKGTIEMGAEQAAADLIRAILQQLAQAAISAGSEHFLGAGP
jgi:hypothetical protein